MSAVRESTIHELPQDDPRPPSKSEVSTKTVVNVIKIGIHSDNIALRKIAP